MSVTNTYWKRTKETIIAETPSNSYDPDKVKHISVDLLEGTLSEIAPLLGDATSIVTPYVDGKEFIFNENKSWVQRGRNKKIAGALEDVKQSIFRHNCKGYT